MIATMNWDNVIRIIENIAFAFDFTLCHPLRNLMNLLMNRFFVSLASGEKMIMNSSVMNAENKMSVAGKLNNLSFT